MAKKTSKASAKIATKGAKKVAAKRADAKPKLLSGGNPQIAKGYGDPPVQAYIAAMPGWKCEVGRRLDALIVRVVPGVAKAVKWNSPFYGMAEGNWFLSFHVFTKYIKVAFFRGASLRPVPPGTSKQKDVRYLDIYEDGFDEAQFADWALAAAAYIDPARLRHVSSIAGGSYGAFGDNWAADRLSKADALGGFLALHFEPGFRLMYAAIGITAEHFRATYFKELLKAVNDYDRQVLLRPGLEDAFCDMSAECFAQGSDGLVQDSELLYRNWTFDVSAIKRRVHIWQGLSDTLVAPFINQTIAERMPGAVWHPVAAAGHFVAVGAADDILAIAADELRAERTVEMR